MSSVDNKADLYCTYKGCWPKVWPGGTGILFMFMIFKFDDIVRDCSSIDSRLQTKYA